MDAKTTRIKIRWKANREARAAAVASITPLPNGRWTVRLGGLGEDYASHAEAVRAIDRHYTVLLLDALRWEGARPAKTAGKSDVA